MEDFMDTLMFGPFTSIYLKAALYILLIYSVFFRNTFLLSILNSTKRYVWTEVTKPLINSSVNLHMYH